MLWAIFNLSRNPGAQRKLLEEIRAVVPPDQDPCGEHIKSMPYLKACLKESMRYGTSRSPRNEADAGDETNAGSTCAVRFVKTAGRRLRHGFGRYHGD